MPIFFSYHEVKKIIDSAANLKHRTMLILIYSSGLRVSEIVNLRADDILREKMLLKIRQGKGNKDRYTILSNIALKALENYWRAYHPKIWLFPGVHKTNQMSIRACQHAFELAKKKAEINKKGGIHTLRHSFATHYLEVGGGLFQLQKFIGPKTWHEIFLAVTGIDVFICRECRNGKMIVSEIIQSKKSRAGPGA